jgi:hypothetical protein
MAALIAEVDARREAEEAEKNRKQPVRRLTARSRRSVRPWQAHAMPSRWPQDD